MLQILMLTVVVIGTFWRTLNYGYIIDDIESEQRGRERPTVNRWKRYWEHFKGWKYTNAKLAHAMTLVVHLVVVLLIYTAFGSNNISFITALLFAINPVNSQVSIWLSGRPYAISTAIILLGMTIIPILPFCYIASTLFSINGIMLPILFTKAQPTIYSVLLLLGIYVVKGRVRGVVKQRISTGTDEMVKFTPDKLIIFFKTMGYYFRHCLFPVRVGMFHYYLHTYGLTKEETESWHKLDKYFFLGIAVAFGSLYGFIFHYSPVTIGLFWFVIMTAQWSNLMVLNHPISERYIYLANVGLMYALANIIIGTPFMWIFLTAYAVRLFYLMPAYTNLVHFWRSNTENFPNVALGYNQLGLAYVEYGNSGSALDSWIRGVQERPNDFRINYNIANVLLGAGQLQKSVPFLKKAEEAMNMKDNITFWRENIAKMKQFINQSGIAV